MVKIESMHFSSVKDNNHVLASRAYFGFIKEFTKIYYFIFKVPLFKCQWIDNSTGVEIHELGFTQVNL